MSLPLWESWVHPGHGPCKSACAANPTAPASQGSSLTSVRKGQLMLKTIVWAFEGLDCPHSCDVVQCTSCISNEVTSHVLEPYH